MVGERRRGSTGEVGGEGVVVGGLGPVDVVVGAGQVGEVEGEGEGEGEGP